MANLKRSRSVTKRGYKKGRTTRIKAHSRKRMKTRIPVTMVRRTGPLANRHICKLRYNAVFTLDPGAATTANQIIRANSLYDPDFTGGGHQPMGRDQMFALYEHCIVLGSKITVTAISGSGSGTSGQYMFGIRRQDDVSTISNMSTTIEQSGSKWKWISALPSRPTTLRMGYSCKKQGEHTKLFDNKDLYQQEAGAGPSVLHYFNVFATAFDQATDASAFSVNMTIEYLCCFYDIIPMTQS